MKTQLNVWLPEGLIKDLKTCAINEGVTLSALVNRLIRKGSDERKSAQ